jgi:crooked neck
MELKSRNVQHARNLFDRAVTLLPRVDQLWYKYVYLEELLQNVPGARQVFERWMQWEPDDKAWQAYIKMEERYDESDRASVIYERWIAVRPDPRVWVKWAKFEEERGKLDKAREVFQTALQFFGDEEEQVEKAQAVFNAFAKMETRLKEYERARVIYKVRRCAYTLLGPLHSLNNSSHYHVFRDQNRRICMQLIPNSRSSMAHGPL